MRRIKYCYNWLARIQALFTYVVTHGDLQTKSLPHFSLWEASQLLALDSNFLLQPEKKK